VGRELKIDATMVYLAARLQTFSDEALLVVRISAANRMGGQ
jgi:hypothetical protein